jgi:hypothetical protein
VSPDDGRFQQAVEGRGTGQSGLRFRRQFAIPELTSLTSSEAQESYC